MANTESQLKKDIGFVVALSIVVGSVIGSGIFMKPGIVIGDAGNSTRALWAWILGGVITLASGLTISEVSAQIPKTGGLYVYMEEVYGKLWGYLTGWVQTFIYGPGVIAALGLYFGSLMAFFFNWPAESRTIIAILTMLFLTLMNSLGTKYGGFIQAFATAGKLIPITGIAVFGLLWGNGHIWSMPSGLTTHAGMGAAILATLWAYDGWILVGFVAGEMKNPAKILPRAIITGLIIVTIAYLSVNMAILHVLPAPEIVKLGENAASTAATHIFGNFGGKLLSIGILVSMFGTMNGKILTFPRVPYAMAERGQLPASRLLSQVHPRFHTPINATLMQIILAALFMTVGNPDRLTDISIFAIYIFYVMAFTAVFILRRRNPNAKRSYSVPGYPLIPILAIVGSSYILVSTVITNPRDTLYALLVTLIGLPIYWYLNRKNKVAV